MMQQEVPLHTQPSHMHSQSKKAHTVLIVDDNPVNRYALARVLAKAGFEVVEAWNAEQVFEAADAADAVILDVFIPDLDGIELCRRLRSRSSTAATPIIHISSYYPAEQGRALALESGSGAFLASPVEASVLTDTIRSLIAFRERGHS